MPISQHDPMPDLLAFIEQWAGSLRPGYGLDEAAIPASLPQALRSLYRAAGRWPSLDRSDAAGQDCGLFGAQDALLPPARLRYGNGKITFLMENQGNWICQVEADGDASPVYSNAAGLWEDGITEPEIVHPSLPHFLVTYCLQELVFGAPYAGTWSGDLQDPSLSVFLQPVWINGSYVFKEPSHSFYLCGDGLLLMDYFGDVWYGALHEAALTRIAAAGEIQPVKP